jgi:DNA-directed RNA polymerase specialized sigma24 family protein
VTDRNATVLASMSIAKRISRRLARRCSSTVGIDDLEQEALLGIMRAAELYEPALGTWETFAWWHGSARALRAIHKSAAVRAGINSKRRSLVVLSLNEPLADGEGEMLELTPTADPSPESMAATRELVGMVAQRTGSDFALFERLAGGYSLREIGEATGITRQAAGFRRLAALDRIKALRQEESDG